MDLQKISPAISLVALAVAIGTAVGTNSGQLPTWLDFVGASKAAPTTPLDGLTRVMFPVQVREESEHHNNMISLAHNWGWDPAKGWSRDPALPSVALTLESFYNDLAELNLDMRPPGKIDPWPGGRAMGFAARHDGSYSTLTLGGQPYNAGSAGVKLTGGTRNEPVVAIYEGGRGGEIDTLRVVRTDGTASVRLQGGQNPSLSFDDDVSLRRAGPGRLESNSELAVPSLRIGNGDALQSVRLHHVELKPARVAAQASRDEVVTVRGVPEGSLVFVNGPEQPNGIAIAGVRVAGEGRVAMRFINMAGSAAQPAAGRYAFLIVESAAGE